MKKIKRKSMLYQTGVEYGDWAMNHVLGCSHGCKYPCYAYLQKKRFGIVKSYEDWCEPKLVSNTLELLEKELTPQRIEKIKNVQLCFTTDPFMMGHPEVSEMTLSAMNMFRKQGIAVTTLTKSDYGFADKFPSPIIPSLVGFQNYGANGVNNYYGISLISLDEDFRKRWEPGTAPYKDRIASLKALHDAGMKTWVSVEPYPFPFAWEKPSFEEFTLLEDLLNELTFVDLIVFGRWNYSADHSSISPGRLNDFYKQCALDVGVFCVANDIECIIKEGTVGD